LSVEIKVPELGENITEGTIVHWAKKAGENISKGETLVEVMTEKVNIEVECPVSGKITEILYSEESVVKVGEIIARIEEKA